MKNIFLVFFSIITFTLNGQTYHDYIIGSQIGTGWDQERGLAFSYDVEIKKHLGSGLYGILAHGILNAEEKINVRTFPFNNDQQLLDQTQAVFWGVGIAKSLAISEKGTISLSLLGQTIQQNRFKLINLQYSEANILELENSTNTHSTRNDFGFSVAMDYQYALSKQVSIGLFSKYQSTPNFALFGLKATSYFNFKSDKNTTPKSSINTNNLLELRIGYGEGDGGNSRWMYDLTYGYKIKNRITILTKLTVAQGDRRLSELLFIRNKELVANSVHLRDNNESNNPVLETIIFNAIGLGTKIKLNKMGKSALSVYGGLSYFMSTKVNINRIVVESEQIVDLRESYSYKNTFSPELGLHYNYQLSNHLYLGASINLVTVPVLFSGGIHLGTNF